MNQMIRMPTARMSAAAVVAFFTLASQASERDALRSLYEAMQGGQWEHREGWLSDAPLGEWHGVTVRNGHVVEIDLAGNRLVGPLPEDIGEQGRLSRLEVLDLRWNTIWNAIPDSIAAMASLESLLLSGNQLSGHIPPSLGLMPRLKRLDLSYNQLTGEIPKELGESRSLRALGLQHNRLTGSLPKELVRIGTLQRLIVHGNELAEAVPHEIDQLGQAIHMKLTDDARGGAFAAATAIRDLDAAKVAVEFPEGVSGLDVLDETTFMMDEETSGLIRRVLAAIVVRDGELHVDSTVVLFPSEADQLERVVEQVNQKLRETGETIRSVTDLERVFELHDQGTVEIQDDLIEFNHPSSEFIFESGVDTFPRGPSSPPSATSPTVEQQGNIGFFLRARVMCPETQANNAHKSKTTPGSIIGKGQVNCIYLSGPPQTLTYVVISYLQRWHSSSWWFSHWRQVGMFGRAVKQGTDVHIAQRKLVAKTPCRSGVYRTRLSLYIIGNVTGRFFPHPGRYASVGERVSC